MGFDEEASTLLRGVGPKISWDSGSNSHLLPHDFFFISRRVSARVYSGGVAPTSRVDVELWAACEVDFGIRDYEMMCPFGNLHWL